MKYLSLALVCFSSTMAFGFEATKDQAAVNVFYEDPSNRFLIVEGETYTMRLDRDVPMIHSFKSKTHELIEPTNPLMPAISTSALWGPGRFNIYRFGTQMYEIHLRDLKWDNIPADIEVVFYCYAKRVFVHVNVTPRGEVPPLMLGWLGGPRYTISQLPFDESELKTALRFEDKPNTLLVLPRWKGQGGQSREGVIIVRKNEINVSNLFWSDEEGTRTQYLMLVAGDDEADTINLVRSEMYANTVSVEVEGGQYNGYNKSKGFYDIATDYSGPRTFEEAWINPNQRYEARIAVNRDESPAVWDRPSDLIFNTHNKYSVLEAAVLTDEDGFPLPVQVQVSKNFGSEFEEGKEEGDAAFSEAYFPVRVAPETPFKGRIYHLFGNWGTHPLKQISSIRFYHHYFHASLGPTETFCYVPFEYPRDDKRNYFLADVRGLTNETWVDEPQHDHVSVVGLLRYQSGGQWINNRLVDTRILLTAPNLANFAVDYLSTDGNVKTTVEVTEAPQEDEARAFMKITLEVLNDVALDAPSAQSLRFLNAGAYIVNTKWPRVTYAAPDGVETTVDVPGDNSWVLEGVPMDSKWAYAAAYPHKNGCMAFYINRVKGQLGGEPVDAFGLSVHGGETLTEMFLTAPKALTHLRKGDHLEAHLFVMPYGGAGSDHQPAARQRIIYGEKMPAVTAIHGTVTPSFPPRIKADSRGFAEFELSGGEDWIPILVEGFPTHKAPMLWEKRGDKWLFVDQQVLGNDWYQAYRDRDGGHGFVLVVKTRPGQTHHYLVALAPNARTITQHNGFVTVTGGPMDFISPLPFATLKNAPVEGTALFRCTGNVDTATTD